MLLLSTLIISTALLTACGRSETNVERGNRDGIIYWGNGAEPQELDPHITTGVPETRVQLALFEPLVARDPKTLEPRPGAASRWEMSADGRVYTFHLNPQGRWSNGEPVTAQDFVWSLWRGMHPKLGNQYVGMYYPIENAMAFSRGEIKDFSQVGVKALDTLTLQLTLAQPTPFFLGLLAHHSYFPVHRATLEAFGNPLQHGSKWTRPGNLVGNGAFMLKEWKLFNVISVVKNPHYHSAAKVALNGINFIPTENTTTEERMFRAGQLHVTNDLPADRTAIYEKDAPEKLVNEPYLGVYFYRFNTKKPPLDNPKLRLALSYAMDREQIVKHVTKQGQIPAFTITPPGVAGYTGESPLGYDPKRARQLLAEAGYPDGRGLPKIELLYNTLESHRKIAVALQQMWKRDLNVDITLRNEDWKVYLESVDTGDYDMARAAWIGDYVDPNTFLDLWISGGGNNRTGWGNREYDRLVLEAAPRAATQEERYALLRKAEYLMLSEAPVIPVYIYTSKHLVDTSVRGLYPNLLDEPQYKYISLAPAAGKR